MSPEELKLVEEFNAAVNSAHTAAFSNHLSKQLEDLQSYVDNYAGTLENLTRQQMDNLQNKYNEQLKAIEKNYEIQLKNLEDKRLKLSNDTFQKMEELFTPHNLKVSKDLEKLTSDMFALSTLTKVNGNYLTNTVRDNSEVLRSAISRLSSETIANQNFTKDRLLSIDQSVKKTEENINKILAGQAKQNKLIRVTLIVLVIFVFMLIISR